MQESTIIANHPSNSTSEAEFSRVQARAEVMIRERGFLGVPTETFAAAGRSQLNALIAEGLKPDSTLLDLGCGCLRAGYWLVRYLDAAGYHGIEPVRARVELGLRYLFTDADLIRKQPQFDFNSRFDSSVFDTSFDFFLAGSIWTHASKQQIQLTLDNFIRDSQESGVFLNSYLPALATDDDYRGDHWVGTGCESNVPGVVRHSLSWIEDQCANRSLSVRELPGEAFDGQTWLTIRRLT